MGTFGASLLGDILSKSLFEGKGVVRAGEGILKKVLILPKRHPLTNREIQNYYKNE